MKPSVVLYTHARPGGVVGRPGPTAVLDSIGRRSTGVLALAGVLGGVAGMVIGIFVGAALDEPSADCEEICISDGTIIGLAVGEGVGVALAVHLANRRQGNFALDAVVSLGILGVGIALAAPSETGRILLVVPVAQIFGTIAMERRKNRAKERRE